MKEINRKEQNYELNINKRNEYWNQLNQIKLALGNRLQVFELLTNRASENVDYIVTLLNLVRDAKYIRVCQWGVWRNYIKHDGNVPMILKLVNIKWRDEKIM
jgi:hypothetical protein